MSTRNVLATITLVLAVGSGCSISVQDSDQISYLADTAAVDVPDGTVQAVVYEIDGERVAGDQADFSLPPGSHTIRVAPARGVSSALSVAGDLDPGREGRRLVPITIAMRPGERYTVAARLVRFRTGILEGDAGPAEHSPWRTAVIPVLIDDRGAVVIASAEGVGI